MKKPSGTKAIQSLRDVAFFTDRDLGKAAPRILREEGLHVEMYFDHFPEGQHVADNEWLRIAAGRKWVALSHDDNIRRDSEAIRTNMENAGRLFILRGSLRGTELAAMFLEAEGSVLQILKENPTKGFVANVRRSVLRGGVVKSAAKTMLTFGEWKAGRRSSE